MPEMTSEEIRDEIAQLVAIHAKREGIEPTVDWLERMAAELMAIEDDEDEGDGELDAE